VVFLLVEYHRAAPFLMSATLFSNVTAGGAIRRRTLSVIRGWPGKAVIYQRDYLAIGMMQL
jgi:hypothetical protein